MVVRRVGGWDMGRNPLRGRDTPDFVRACAWAEARAVHTQLPSDNAATPVWYDQRSSEMCWPEASA